MSDLNSLQHDSLSTQYRKVDRRYRESNYFLMDQLRYADSVQEFRTIKKAILRSSEFDVGKRAFQFEYAPLEPYSGLT